MPQPPPARHASPPSSHAHPVLPRGAQSDMGDPPADEDEEAESARARSEGGSEADEDLEDDEVDSDEETDVDSDDDMVCSRPCRDACTRRTRAPHAPPGGEAPPLGHPPRPPHAQPAKTHALYPSRFACRARPPAPAPAVHTRASGPAHSRLGRAQSRPAPPHLPPPAPNPPPLAGGEAVGAVVHRAERVEQNVSSQLLRGWGAGPAAWSCGPTHTSQGVGRR